MSKKLLEDVFGRQYAEALWATGYKPAFVITIQDFSIGGVLPAILYMMRWGHRRGKGTFGTKFERPTASGKMRATINTVTDGLLGASSDCFDGFDKTIHQAILGDLLLATTLENNGYETGRDVQVQRVYPSHYFSSWVDLPVESANLRFVPELLTNLLSEGGHFSPGIGFERNLLLSLFGAGVSIKGSPSDVKSDSFDESTDVGIDQLLAIRLAQSLGEAPLKVRGKNPEISKQRPISERASHQFYEDFNVFLRAYGGVIPRLSLIPILESAIALGMTCIFTSAMTLLLEWSENGGTVIPVEQQTCWPLFVDCSAGEVSALRLRSEESVDDLYTRSPRVAVIATCLRLVDRWAVEERVSGLPAADPDPAARLEFLGALLFDKQNDHFRDLRRDHNKECHKLAEKCEEEGSENIKRLLLDDSVHPSWRLSEAICLMMKDKAQGYLFRKALDSCFMLGRPNGLAQRRKSSVQGRKQDRRSVVLSNSVIDYIVHRALRKANKNNTKINLSLAELLLIMRTEYGLHIDESPPEMSIPKADLLQNRICFERRLRDLGLLIGVNDAETMKKLRARYGDV